MKKLGLYLLICITVLFTECKKDSAKEEVTPDTKPGEYIPDGTSKFLKNLIVPGSEKISFDTLYNNFVVSLPKGFNNPEIEIKLSLFKTVKLLDSTASVTSDSIIKFPYKGSAPLRFSLQESKGKQMSFTVFVEVPGPPIIELLSNEIPLSTGPMHLPVRITSGFGTTPMLPGQSNPQVKFIDRKTGFNVEGIFYDNLGSVYVPDAAGLINSQNLALEFYFADQQPIAFENIRFKRGLPSAYLTGYDNVLIAKKDSMLIAGGYFISGVKYTVQFSNDYLASPVSGSMLHVDSSRITASVPENIPDGSYLATFYEDDKVIGRTSIYFSKTKTHSIETIWAGNPNQPQQRNTEKLSFAKGDVFYAKPWPPKYGMSSTPASAFEVKDLPDMRLNNGTVSMDLKPQLMVYSWAVAGLTYSYGKYTVPENLESGAYEASLVFPDKTESKPYWSKIRIQ